MHYQYEIVKTEKGIPAKILIQDLRKNNRYIPLHWHRSLEIDLIDKGSMNVFLNGKYFILNETDIFFVNSSELHQMNPYQSNIIKTITILISYDFMKENYADFDQVTFNIYHEDFPILILKKYMYQLREVYQSNVPERVLKCNLLLYTILDLVISHAEIIPKDNHSLTREVDDFRIKYAISYIKKNYDKQIDIHKLLNEVRLSRTSFSRLFKKITGYSFNQMLINYRVQQAYNDLITTQSTILEIALKNGFPGSESFMIHFKKKYGMSPNKYRKLLNFD